ncbi:MAG: hypothetical protein HY815_33845 [Candidatus Riflebacteria bacterium]|nr:hypothetical protein [Candidatus Riflebacteria bacterium]
MNLFQVRAFFRKRRVEGQLSAALKRELDGFPGFWRGALEEGQRRKIQLLRKLAGSRGLPEIESGTIIGQTRLGAWVLRCCKRHREGRLDPWLERELERIPGWTWKPSRAEQTERKLDLLERFLEDRSYEDLVHHPMLHGVNLHSFVLHLRKSYNKGRMSDELIRACERLPDWSWHPLEDRRRLRRSSAHRRSDDQDDDPPGGRAG